MEKMSKKYEIKVAATDSEFTSATILCSDDAVKFARGFYLYESAFIMLLNRANRVIGWAKISQGGISETPVDIRIVCKYAVDVLASGVILVHNHPSDNPLPGNADKVVTGNLKRALDVFGINLLDSIIITHDRSYSFADEGTC